MQSERDEHREQMLNGTGEEVGSPVLSSVHAGHGHVIEFFESSKSKERLNNLDKRSRGKGGINPTQR